MVKGDMILKVSPPPAPPHTLSCRPCRICHTAVIARARTRTRTRTRTRSLQVFIDGCIQDIAIKQGEMFMLPAHIPHSPQRFADTVMMGGGDGDA